jgi:hypothetical protein
MGRFSPATSSTKGGEIGKDASKKGTTSADVVVQAFAPISRNLQNRHRRRPNPTRKVGCGDGLAAAPLAAAPKDAGREKQREKPTKESTPRQNRQSGQQQADPVSFTTETTRERGRQMAGRKGPGSEEAHIFQVAVGVHH